MAIDRPPVKTKENSTNAPPAFIDNKAIVVSGKWIKIASVFDELWLEGQVIDSPEFFLTRLKESHLRADIFTFAQKIPDIKPLYRYPIEWDNVAAIPLLTYEDWWASTSTDLRKDIKRAAKLGVIARSTEFNDELVRGIIEIHNETPIRQGKYFKHYGKDFDTVKREYSTYLERSEFIAAYSLSELIGLIKIVYVGELACIMEILSKIKHYDKRPTNALIAKAVEICVEKGKTYLTYGNYYYGNKVRSSFVDFKRRNGFERIIYPRYYVPLTANGWIAVKLKLYRGLIGILPGNLISLIVGVRSLAYKRLMNRLESQQ